MDRSSHTLACLFAQLGLANSDKEIERFIEQHKGLAPHIPVEKASIWSASQAAFLQEALAEDSDWTEVVDGLSARLR